MTRSTTSPARRAAGAGWSWQALTGLAMGVAVAATACGTGTGGPAGPARPHTHSRHAGAQTPTRAAPASLLGEHSLPAQTSRTLPAFPAFYDAHRDMIIVTDAFPKSAAAAFHVNYAPSVSAVQPASQPAWYIVRGRSAAGQLAVLGSEPGESDYSPLWRTVVVRWRPGFSAKVLTSDNMILALAKKGELTATTTSDLVNATVVAMP